MPGRCDTLGSRFPVSAVAVLVLLLVSQALPVPFAHQGAKASGQDRSGEVLVVSDTYTVDGSESWDQVQVWTDGRLVIEELGTLFARSVNLTGVLELKGGSLLISGSDAQGASGLFGQCRELTMSSGSVLVVEGEAGHASVADSHGQSMAIDVTASSRIRLEEALIKVEGGPGYSPHRPYTDGALGGKASAGGSATLSLVVASTGTTLEIINSSIHVNGGDGGDAPDGTAPHGGTGGMGGGFSGGGQVTGEVGSGGRGRVGLSASEVIIEGMYIEVKGGKGGDAGDGASVPPDVAAGGGGGGYSGGPGADADALHATMGGSVIGRVGAGGDARFRVEGMDCHQTATYISVLGGRGGEAGDGGDSSGEGGGGGGGYSGGGGGSSPRAAGADGGYVGFHVGHGGDASVRYDLDGDLATLDSWFMALGGDGGNAGHGGSVVRSPSLQPMGGAGGGGYSGGGGGASGLLVDNLTVETGTDGGDGGRMSQGVAVGGDSDLRLIAKEACLDADTFWTKGGAGGQGGLPGGSLWIGDVWNEVAGGGGGSYSGGGGAGSNGWSVSGGTGGRSGGVLDDVGDGGDASLLLDLDNATILGNNDIKAERGDKGSCLSPEGGELTGKGGGRLTSMGMKELYIPRSRGVPILPEDGTIDSSLPKFTWAPIHPSTDGGAVVGYELMVDDDADFSSPEWTVIVPTESYDAIWVPNFTFYWRVAPRYANPPNPRGIWSEPRVFEYVNLPPVIGEIPLMTVRIETVTRIELAPYIDDPDDDDDRLHLECYDPHLFRKSDLNLSVYFGEENTGHVVRFSVTDGLSRVYGEFAVQALRHMHPPYIRGLEGIRPPIRLTIEEGASEWYDILVHDVDSDEFNYSTSGWPGVIAHENGTLQVVAGKGEVDTFKAILTVTDEVGQTAEMGITVVVTNVNDPPRVPVVISPDNGTSVPHGALVRFVVSVEDDDVRFGQRLKVSFISNSSGVLKTIETDGVASFSHSGLQPGDHRISVVATDGRYSSNTWFILTVEGPPEPSTVVLPQTEEVDPTLYLMAVAVLFMVSFGVGRWITLRRRPTG